jgi:hypothetical protein
MALMEMANADSALHGDETGYDKAAAGILARLRAGSVDPQVLESADSPG